MKAFVVRLREERATARLYARWGLYSKRRPVSVRALGVVLLPLAVTEAWYAADCPRVLDRRAVPLRDWLVWRLSCVLRGTVRTAA